MLTDAIRALVRRAILDLLEDIGGENNDAVLAEILAELGHRIARRDVAEQLRWLAERDLIRIKDVTPFLVAEIEPDGRDVSRGRLRIDGVSRHHTGR